MTNEEIPATNGVSSVGEESTMEGVTNGEMETEEAGVEVTKAKEEKSIMEMIAAGDFDAEENAAPDDASTNDKSVQPTEEAVIKEEEKVSEVIQEASEEKSKEVSDEEKKEEQEGEGTSASAGDEVGSGEFKNLRCNQVIRVSLLTIPLQMIICTTISKVMMTSTQRKTPQGEYL